MCMQVTYFVCKWHSASDVIFVCVYVMCVPNWHSVASSVKANQSLHKYFEDYDKP